MNESRRVIDMHDDDELDPVARLRAADPAASVEPRAGFADDVVARATAPSADASPAEPSPVADLASERARRRPTWVAIAAVAASLVVFSGAGYALGASTNGSTDVAVGAAPPVSLQGAAGGATTEQGAAQDGAFTGAVPEPAKRSASGATDMIHPGGYGRNTFRSSGLSTASGSASGYGYDARAASNAETIGALAAALGVNGTPELKDGAWTVGPQDGSAPSLYVGLDGMLSFSYSDPLLNPWNCAKTDADGGDVSIEPCEPATVALPSESAAIDALRSLISSVGRDAGAFEYTSETWEGAVTRSAQAWPVLDGQRVDQAWSLELTDGGVVSASGALAEVVSLGDYPVVSEQDAFERLSDPRFGAQVIAMPLAAREQAAVDAPDASTASPEWTPPTEPPATPSDGASVAWPVNDVEIVGARLGLASQWQPDGSVLIVPAYEFTDAAGGTWSVIAVADSKLDFATE
jgi:hypothetical protein